MENQDQEQNKSIDKEKLSIFGLRYWDLWLQKFFNNISSMKFIILAGSTIPVFYGMFTGHWTIVNGVQTFVSIIPATLGMGYLGLGFVTLATSRTYTDSIHVNSQNSGPGINPSAPGSILQKSLQAIQQKG